MRAADALEGPSLRDRKHKIEAHHGDDLLRGDAAVPASILGEILRRAGGALARHLLELITAVCDTTYDAAGEKQGRENDGTLRSVMRQAQKMHASGGAGSHGDGVGVDEAGIADSAHAAHGGQAPKQLQNSKKRMAEVRCGGPCGRGNFRIQPDPA